MRCQILFSRKDKKNISKCRLLKFLPSMQSVNKKYTILTIVLLNWIYPAFANSVDPDQLASEEAN